MSSLAIVIPTLDEERALPDFLPRALAAGDEVCVSDGGSRDATIEIARSLGAHVVTGPPGRGPQLNRGARATGSEVLLFLHADTRLPEGAAGLVRQAVAGGAVGGGFLVRFEPARGSLRLAHRMTTLRTRLTGCPLGDQAQFVRRDVFEALGGFREWPILEDLDFMRRLKRRGRVAILDRPVTTSARRFVSRGVWRTSATNYLIWALYFAGVSPARLARLYDDIR
jgi:rSAM/selenodomain-associated transferase 2